VVQLAAAADGRHLRREQNREAVIDALLALFAAGNYQPSSAEIATRAGLSPRSLFRYFDDVDDLHRAAAARQILLALPLLELDTCPQDPTAVKIERVAHARARLFEHIGPAARALRVSAHRHDVLATELDLNRSFRRDQLRQVFAPELAAATSTVLPAIDVLCSFECYELLRHDQGLSRTDAVGTLIAALTALLIGQPDA
jgi:AcrR family transcriptional regulator